MNPKFGGKVVTATRGPSASPRSAAVLERVLLIIGDAELLLETLLRTLRGGVK